MAKNSYFLSDVVRSVLSCYSSNYPNKVVNPTQLTCFVVEQKCGKHFYYPVNSIVIREETKYSLTGSTYYVYKADINIDIDTYCQNPIGIQTPLTGASIIRLEERERRIPYNDWYCPQLEKRLIEVSPNREASMHLAPLLKEGILLFIPVDR